MKKQLSMISLFEIFIKDTAKGKRRKLNMQKIKPSSVENYRYTLKLLREYEVYTGKELLIKTNTGNNQRLVRQEKNYWDNFYRQFSRFLFYEKGYYDNYCGDVFKHIKCFFRYMKNEKFLPIPECYKRFYVRKEEIGIVTLLPERFCFLVMDQQFNERLNSMQRRYRDIFVFGCISALRYADLFNLRIRDVEKRGADYFLNYRSLKTDTHVKIKLPEFAISIFNKYSRRKKPHQKLFLYVSLNCFNIQIRRLGRLAGWTEPVAKFRRRDGEQTEIKYNGRSSYRFCDLLSSHVMRRTGITILLMLGMPEYLVRKISGHTAHSESFFRYVNFANSYVTDEINKVHSQLAGLYRSAAQDELRSYQSTVSDYSLAAGL
ncbi:MAG: hypothetical protein ABI675_18305 [Chitinophagaceae bacterium]